MLHAGQYISQNKKILKQRRGLNIIIPSIGRTGRAENPGDAITFVSEEDQHHFGVIQKKMKRSVDMLDSDTLDFR